MATLSPSTTCSFTAFAARFRAFWAGLAAESNCLASQVSFLRWARPDDELFLTRFFTHHPTPFLNLPGHHNGNGKIRQVELVIVWTPHLPYENGGHAGAVADDVRAPKK